MSDYVIVFGILWLVVAFFLLPLVFTQEYSSKYDFCETVLVVLLWPVGLLVFLCYSVYLFGEWFYKLPWRSSE